MATEASNRLRSFAESECLPYLLSLDRFNWCGNSLAFLLVDSVAAGIAEEGSDVDVCVLYLDELGPKLTAGTNWTHGRPSEVVFSGNQLHYYGASVADVQARLKALDDTALYVYSSAVVLRDRTHVYEDHLVPLLAINPAVRKQRIEGKLDMLLRRGQVLAGPALEGGDPLVAARVALEVISLSLKVIALLDGILFDPRKRLTATALSGSLGRQLRSLVMRLLGSLGEFAELSPTPKARNVGFAPVLQELIERLSKAAAEQGCRVGLEVPDHRHLE